MQRNDVRPRGGRTRKWRTARALGAVSVLVLAAAPGAVSDDGLPTKESGRLRGVVVSTGLSSAPPAKQYFRVPLTELVTDVSFNANDTISSVYAISPKGSPKPYGYFPPIKVRTLAFGIVPAEATITLAQLRKTVPDTDPGTPDPDGPKTEDVPVPWLLVGPPISEGQHTMTGSADLRVASLVLDGVKVPIGTKCRAKTPAKVTLNGQPGYIPSNGGSLAGLVSVPAFTGCGVNGEDLSPLITSMVSGGANTLQIRQSEIASATPYPREIPEPFPLPSR